MEFKIELDRLRKRLKWVYITVLIVTFLVFSLYLRVSGAESTYTIGLSGIYMLIMAFVFWKALQIQMKKYANYVVKVEDLGILIHDLEGRDVYFIYENIKHISLPSENLSAVIVSKNKEHATLLNQIEDYATLINILKSKNIPITNQVNYWETAGQMNGNMKKPMILMIITFCLVIVLQWILKNF
ncbi:MAG: hypothetical protein AB2421_08385 [Thermotaleaceae bacterium]